MLNLTLEQITAAKNNDASAVAHVVNETEERVTQLARKYATTGGFTDYALMDDLAQEGRIELWKAIARFEGVSVAQFFTFIDQTLKGVMSSQRRASTRHGVSEDVAKYFESALTLAHGDPYEAERICTDAEIMGKRRMSTEMAYAARLSWQGLDSIDTPATTDEGDETTIGDRVHSTIGLPEDLIEPRDIETARQRETARNVHDALNKMGKKSADILRGTYGVSPAPMAFGTENEDLLADWVGMAKSLVRQNRSKAKTRFRDLYLKGANS
jgi:RNA polymerase sigma factor (sigma-70 family)